MAKSSQNERIEFYFPRPVLKLLRQLVPPRERSRFVAEAAERELKRKLFQERLEDLAEVEGDSYQTTKLRWRRPKALRQ